MLSHCAGVAPADCPEYSKRPEHNPNVCSLDCCSKFRSLMTVASGVFERNIAHVFNLRCSLLIYYTTSVWATYRDPSWRVGDTSPGGPLGHLLETAGPRTPRERERLDICITFTSCEAEEAFVTPEVSQVGSHDLICGH